MNQGYIIRVKKAFFHPDQGVMPLVGVWHGSLDELKHWLIEQDYSIQRYEVSEFHQAGLLIRFSSDPNKPDEVTDVLGTDLDEYASYDHSGGWIDLAAG